MKKALLVLAAVLLHIAPAQPTDTALLFFRDYPGIAVIETVADKSKNLQPFMRMNQKLIASEIAWIKTGKVQAFAGE
jgi:hypothetical protein